MGENRLVVELFFEKPSFGEVSKMAAALEEAGISTILLPPEDRSINTHLAVERSDLEKTRVKMVEMGIRMNEKEVVLIRMNNQPGAMAEIVRKISNSGINLTYAFSVAMNAEMSYLLLSGVDNNAIVKLSNL